MDHDPYTPGHLAKDYATSTEEQRRDLIKGISRMLAKGLSRDAIIAKAIDAGWSDEFSKWAFVQVKHYGEVTILPPISNRVRRAVIQPSLVEADPTMAFNAVAGRTVISVILSIVAIPFGIFFTPRILDVFQRKETGEGEWVDEDV